MWNCPHLKSVTDFRPRHLLNNIWLNMRPGCEMRGCPNFRLNWVWLTSGATAKLLLKRPESRPAWRVGRSGHSACTQLLVRGPETGAQRVRPAALGAGLMTSPHSMTAGLQPTAIFHPQRPHWCGVRRPAHSACTARDPQRPPVVRGPAGFPSGESLTFVPVGAEVMKFACRCMN